MTLTAPQKQAVALGGGRVLNGLLLLAWPSLPAALYLGPGGRTPTARALGRFVGARDVITGIGALLAVPRRTGDVEIVGAAALCEAIDAAISLGSPGVAWRMRAAAGTAVLAAGAGFWAARGLAADRRAPSAAG